MKRSLLFASSALMALLLVACSNIDNETADKIDGTWTFDSWKYAGTDSIPGDTITESLGVWTFTSCMASREECDGTQTGFLGGTAAETFVWFVSEEGKQLSMGDGAFADDTLAASMAQVTGQWLIYSLSDTRMVLTSSTCGSCVTLGEAELTFSKE